MDRVNAPTRERGNAEIPDADAAILLALAGAAGLTVLTSGGRLIVRGPRAAAAVAQRLLDRKAAVLAALPGFPRFRVSAFAPGRVALVVDDGLIACADCGRACYGVAGYPALCPRCLRARAGLPARWWETRGRGGGGGDG